MSEESPLFVIHDCDPGPDDAIALMLSFASSSWTVKAITTVGGNVRVEACAHNARRVAALCGAKIPVYLGSERPIKGRIETLESIFTASGLPGAEELTDLGETWTPADHAVDFLADQLALEQRLTICATAPLTNLALAIEKNPAKAANIEHLVIMGGCMFPEPVRGEMGNYSFDGSSRKAEYNFAMDPLAASIVLSSPVKRISLVGLNLTRKLLFNSHWQKRFIETGSVVGKAAAKILATTSESHRDDLGHLRTSPDDPVRAVHDAITVVYMEKPSLFRTQSLYLKVASEETSEPPGYCTVSSTPGPGYSRSAIDVVCDADPGEVFEHMCLSFARYRQVETHSHLASSKAMPHV